MSSNIKVLGWLNLGSFPNLGLPYFSVVTLEGDNGLAFHEWDNAGSYSISFFDGRTLAFTGRCSIVGLTIGNNFTQMPVVGKIIGEGTIGAYYVWGLNSGAAYRCNAPGNPSFGVNNQFSPVFDKGNYLYAPIHDSGANLSRSGQSTPIFFHKASDQTMGKRTFTSAFFGSNQFSCVAGAKETAALDVVWQYNGRLVSGCGYNYAPTYGLVCPNPWRRLIPDALYDTLNSIVVDPEVALPYNYGSFGLAPSCFTDAASGVTDSFNYWPNAEYLVGVNQTTQISLDTFTQNILNYYQNLSGRSFLSQNFVMQTPDNQTVNLLYFERNNRRVYPITTALPGGFYGYQPCAGQMIVLTNSYQLQVLAIEFSDMTAQDVINMSRLRSE